MLQKEKGEREREGRERGKERDEGKKEDHTITHFNRCYHLALMLGY